MISELSIAIPLVAACVFLSAFCSGTEVALFSLRRVDREQLARSGLAADRRILRLLERPRRLIATVLLGNLAFDSVLAVTLLAVVFRYDPTGSVWANTAIALALALALVVLLAEVTAKTLAAKWPLAWSRTCALPLSLIALLVSPIRLVMHYASEIFLRPLGASARTRPARDLSAEEFRSMIDAGSAQGQVDARERRLIHRVFEFNDKNVGQVMTPRERMFALSYDLPMQRLVKEVAGRGFSRVPIYQKTVDNIRGILNAKDLVGVATGKPLGRPLGELLHEPLFVPRTTPVKRLFLIFKQKKVHMALVVSEYGKVLGIVTMDDLLSQIFGVLRDERADLQNSIPAGRTRVRTPVPSGTQRTRTTSSPDLGDDNVQIERATSDVTGPVPREIETGPVPTIRAESEPGLTAPLDPPPPPGLRPIHPIDELTPPAMDLDDFQDKRRSPRRACS
ncbi:MAG: hemolysin family protein [Kofleriaceae bacterium]